MRAAGLDVCQAPTGGGKRFGLFIGIDAEHGIVNVGTHHDVFALLAGQGKRSAMLLEQRFRFGREWRDRRFHSLSIAFWQQNCQCGEPVLAKPQAGEMPLHETTKERLRGLLQFGELLGGRWFFCRRFKPLPVEAHRPAAQFGGLIDAALDAQSPKGPVGIAEP